MPDQFCPHCGTEVDADARFCPTCGQALSGESGEPSVDREAATGGDPDETSPIPPAPAWPPPEQPSAEDAEEAEAAGEPVEASPPPSAEEGEEEDEEKGQERSAMEASPAAAEPPAAPPPPGPPPAQPVAPGSGGGSEMPFTVPVMLSGWLIGGGSGLAALALLPRLANLLNLLLFVGLLWVTATVFLADRMPRFAEQRLGVLVVVMIATGAALDRSGFRVNVSSIFLVAILAAAVGVLLIELGRDRPVQTGGSR